LAVCHRHSTLAPPSIQRTPHGTYAPPNHHKQHNGTGKERRLLVSTVKISTTRVSYWSMTATSTTLWRTGLLHEEYTVLACRGALHQSDSAASLTRPAQGDRVAPCPARV